MRGPSFPIDTSHLDPFNLTADERRALVKICRDNYPYVRGGGMETSVLPALAEAFELGKRAGAMAAAGIVEDINPHRENAKKAPPAEAGGGEVGVATDVNKPAIQKII